MTVEVRPTSRACLATRSALAALGLLLLPCSCISASYVRATSGSPLDETAVGSIEPNVATLGDCLTALGAPELVWQSDGSKIKLAYAWTDTVDWGLSVSWSLQQFASVQLSLDSVDFESESIVFEFGHDLRLEQISRGYLWELAPSAQATSAGQRLVNNTPR